MVPGREARCRIQALGCVVVVSRSDLRPPSPGQLDQNILQLIEGADLVLYDCTDAEFPAKVGWGHSTWQEGVRPCRAAGARRLGIAAKAGAVSVN